MAENITDTNVGNIEYIRRQDVLNLPQSIERNLRGEIVERSIDVKAIESLPYADVAPVVHSRWMPQKGGGLCCSECDRYALDEPDGNFIHVSVPSKFCPHCGAKMDKGD